MSIEEVLKYNYWEHIKAEKELSFILSPEHPRRVEIHNAAEEILKLLNQSK